MSGAGELFVSAAGGGNVGSSEVIMARLCQET